MIQVVLQLVESEARDIMDLLGETAHLGMISSVSLTLHLYLITARDLCLRNTLWSEENIFIPITVPYFFFLK